MDKEYEIQQLKQLIVRTEAHKLSHSILIIILAIILLISMPKSGTGAEFLIIPVFVIIAIIINVKYNDYIGRKASLKIYDLENNLIIPKPGKARILTPDEIRAKFMSNTKNDIRFQSQERIVQKPTKRVDRIEENVEEELGLGDRDEF